MNKYFNESFNTFFKGLAAHNERDWFHANKKTYEKEVKEPFYALVVRLIERIDKEGPGLDLELKQAVFRINRDIRFSKDKNPYKLHVGAALGPGGRKGVHRPGHYLHLGVEEAWIGGGIYMSDKDDLMKIRKHLIKNYDEAESILNEPEFKKLFGELKGDKNKILPKEIKEQVEGKPLVFNKQFYYMANYDGAKTAVRKDLEEFIMKHFKVGLKWNAFLAKAFE
jgi:uncharacterized protein (TIGR02453 family)